MTALTSSATLFLLLTAGALLAQQEPASTPAAAAAPAPVPASTVVRDTRPLTAADAAAMTFGAVADKILPSVISIRALDGVALGSGFIVSAEGHILTARSVVDKADTVEVMVRVQGEMRNFTARVVHQDPQNDVAVLKVAATDLPKATLGDSSHLRARDVVMAAGAAMRPHRSAVLGSVQDVPAGAPIETDIAIRALEIGGPLVDALGRVVGINVASAASERSASAGFAIPINAALPALERLPSEGAGPRGFLGIQINDFTSAGTVAVDPAEPRHVTVTMIGAGSPAELAGVKVGDVIAAVDGVAIPDSNALRGLVGSKKPGDAAAIEVLRDGRPMKFTMTLTEVPTGPAAAAAAAAPAPLPQAANAGEMIPGLTISNLTAEVRQQHGIPEQLRGVLVTEVAPETGAAAVGVRQGDLITQVNRTPVASVGEARDLVAAGQKTVLIKVYRQGDSMLFMVGR